MGHALLGVSSHCTIVPSGFTAQELGVINSMWFLGFPLSMLVGGLIYHSVGPKKIMQFAFFAHSVGILMTIFSASFMGLLISTFLIGLGNGFALGLVAAGIAWATKQDPMLGLLLGMAMIVNMFVAATAGTLVPLSLKALKVDPALASSVFITTFTDVAGFASFLGLATVFLRYLVKVQ